MLNTVCFFLPCYISYIFTSICEQRCFRDIIDYLDSGSKYVITYEILFYINIYIFQVSAGQQLHLSGDIKSGVSVAAQQGMFFSQSASSNSSPNAGTNPAGTTSSSNAAGGGGMPQTGNVTVNESYTVSQSQTINFTQQTLRQRQQQQQQQQQHHAATAHPGMGQATGTPDLILFMKNI